MIVNLEINHADLKKIVLEYFKTKVFTGVKLDEWDINLEVSNSRTGTWETGKSLRAVVRKSVPA